MSMYDSTNHNIKGSILTFLYLQIYCHDVKLAYLEFEKKYYLCNPLRGICSCHCARKRRE